MYYKNVILANYIWGGVIMKKYQIYGMPTKDAAWLSFVVEDENNQLWDKKYKRLTIRKKQPKKHKQYV